MHPDSAAVGVIVVAAGSGSRLGAEVPKAFVPLAGVPILGHALRGVLSCSEVAEVVVVAPRAWLGPAQATVDAVCRWAGSSSPAGSAPAALPSSERTVHRPGGEPFPSSERTVHRPGGEVPVDRALTRGEGVPVRVVAGGAERGDSVAAGLAALSGAVQIVLVHDAARCLTPVAVFERVVAAVRGGAVAVVPGVAVVDTIKQVDAAGVVVATPQRSSLRAVQTPQGFRRNVLERAHARSSDATDDAALVEALGEPVLVVDGDALAFKVTTPADLEAATRILAG